MRFSHKTTYPRPSIRNRHVPYCCFTSITTNYGKVVKRTLRAIVPEGAFARTEEKIEHSFAAGYGTVLFFEDTDVVRGLQQQFPAYAGNFPVWSEQTSAMHQLAVWTMLEDAGLGVIAPTLQPAHR